MELKKLNAFKKIFSNDTLGLIKNKSQKLKNVVKIFRVKLTENVEKVFNEDRKNKILNIKNSIIENKKNIFDERLAKDARVIKLMAVMEASREKLFIKKDAAVLLAATLVIVLAVGLSVKENIYLVKLDGNNIAYVNSAGDVDRAKNLTLHDCIKSTGNDSAKVEADRISCTVVDVDNKKVNVVSDEVLAARLSLAEVCRVRAWAIVADEKTVVANNSKKQVEKVLKGVKSYYENQYAKGNHIIEAGFKEKVSIKKTMVYPGKIMSAKDGFYHVVNVAQTSDQAPLNYITRYVFSYQEGIPFNVIKQQTNTMYKGETKVAVQGQYGIKNVTSEVTRENGKWKASRELSSAVASNPKNQLFLEGTKKKPAGLLATTTSGGKLGKPMASLRMSCAFGASRGSRRHEGVDFRTSVGTQIYAAQSGVVTKAARLGSYGNVVFIKHANGLETRYAHCSSLQVKAGQSVVKGQPIAKSGNTGRSTGPHLHFEVRVGGVAKNPLAYM